MRLRLFAVIALMCATASGGWPRNLGGIGQDVADSRPPHPLAYFRADPCLRPASDSVGSSLGCTWAGVPPPSPELDRRASVGTELTEVGKIGKLKIYDLWYSRGIEGSPGGDPSLRSILVETAPGEFREIDVQTRHGYLFPASEIVELDGERILIAKSHDGGNHNRIDETLYMFRSSGLEKPDFKAVSEAVVKLMPPNMSVRAWTHDYAAMTDLVETYRNDRGLPPVSVTERCRISVTYRFVNGRAEVTGSNYEPYSQ